MIIYFRKVLRLKVIDNLASMLTALCFAHCKIEARFTLLYFWIKTDIVSFFVAFRSYCRASNAELIKNDDKNEVKLKLSQTERHLSYVNNKNGGF